MCVVVHVWEAARVVGHYTMVAPAPGRFVVGGPRLEATDVVVGLPVVLAGCVGVRGVGWRRLACGGGWDFKHGANGGPAVADPQFRSGSVSNVVAGVDASLRRAEWP